MNFLAFPPPRALEGTLRVPSSKSGTNRALVLAALASAPVEIARPLESDDTIALRRCLEAMGARISPAPDGGVLVSGPLGAVTGGEVLLDASDSGTAARFLAAIAAAVPGRYVLDGSARLRERPMGELVRALQAGGSRIAYRGAEGCLPLGIEGGALRSGEIAVDASRSSQFLSALLLAAVAVEGGLRVTPSGSVASSPYVATTLEALRDFGHEAGPGGVFAVRRGASGPARYEVPGDYSSAVPLLAAVGAAGGAVTLTGLRWPSADADARALPVLEAMGIRIAADARSVAASAGPRDLRPASVLATDFPDAVPALAALAALAPGESVFSGIGHLRLKESDRLAALAALVSAAGGSAVAREDSLVVKGPASPAASGAVRLPTFRDHRVAMAAGLISLRVPGILIEDPDCVSKSYPRFFRDLETLAVR